MNKIIDMLTSSEEEMIVMGVIMALNEGPDWCKENIPHFGLGTPNRSAFMIHTNIGERLRDKGWKKGGIIIHITSIIDCRYSYQFSQWVINNAINLDNETI